MDKKDNENTVFDDEQSILLDHDYDGIQELDNPLPQWWLMTFYGAVVFSIFYVGYYHLFGGPSLDQELQTSMASIEMKQEALRAEREAQGENELKALLQDPERIASGREAYMGKCAACHKPDGGGLIGPNLTDPYWIHGDASIKSIRKIVAEGVPEKGMPPWAAVLSDEELIDVTLFVVSLIGTNPPGAKEAQGERVESGDM